MAMGPFAIDVYLPAFPVIAADLGAAESQVALTLSLFIFGLAFGQIIGGPLSDRYGRAPVLLTGLAVYTITALMVAASTNLTWMITWRVIMAFGSGWIMISVPALVRDNAHGKEAARLFSLVALIMFIAPALAPTLGSLLLWIGDWSLIFLFIAGYSLLVAALLWFKLLRHLPKRDIKQEPLGKLLTNYVQVLTHPIAWRHIVIQALGFSVLMLFVTHASFMYQGWFGLNNAQFSIAFATGVGLMGVMGMINRRLLLTYSPVQLLKIAVSLQLVALVLMNILLAFNSNSLWSFLPMMVVVGGTVGAIAPNNQAAYLEYFSQLSGTASALIGALQFVISGAVTTLSTLLVDGSITRITLAMLLFCIPACLTTLSLPSAQPSAETPTQ